jgi:hypothetical protein
VQTLGEQSWRGFRSNDRYLENAASFVESMMGWPIGWTDLKPLVTDKCHSAPPQHLNYLERD